MKTYIKKYIKFNINNKYNKLYKYIMNNIYLYWVGKEYKLITILRKFIYLHSLNNYTVNLITDKNIVNYIKDIPNYFFDLKPAHQADYVRVCILNDKGGIWLDSDTLVMNSLEQLFDNVNNKNGFFIKENNTILWNGVFGTKPNTDLTNEWKNRIINILNKKKENIEWSEIGCILLQDIYNKNKNLFKDYEIYEGLDNMYPVNWNNCVTEFINKPYDNYKNIEKVFQPIIVLVNSVYKNVENLTFNEILTKKTPLNYFINKSLKSVNSIEYLNVIESEKVLFDNIYSDYDIYIKINYIKIIESDEFKNKLNILNNNLKEKLEKEKVPTLLIGNLFYDHLQQNPQFYNSPLYNECEEKRIRLFKYAKKAINMFEFGAGGGHSSFLCLMANNKLKVYGNDIATYHKSVPTAHPEFYVEIAFKTLSEIFNNRFIGLKGDSFTEISKFIKENPDLKIDLVHIDGDSLACQNDFFNILPLLSKDAIIIFDDTHLKYIQDIVNNLITHQYVERIEKKMDDVFRLKNEVVKCVNRKSIFENIYKNKIWNNNNKNIPLSGPGSSLENTSSISILLDDFINKNNCEQILDLGCGDLNWIKNTLFFNNENINYIGIDIVETLINEHKINYPTKTFYCSDILDNDIINYTSNKKISFIILRDVIFHLNNINILEIFKNIKNKFNYIAITSCNCNINTDIFDIYNYNKKNINIKPFNISKTFINRIYEDKFDRYFYIYSHDNFYNNNLSLTHINYINNLSEIPMYYINLKNSSDRRIFMETQFKKYNLNVSRIDAIWKHSPVVVKLIKKIKVKNINELSCFLSHILAIQTAYNNNDKYAIIMEDNIILERLINNEKKLITFLNDNLSENCINLFVTGPLNELVILNNLYKNNVLKTKYIINKYYGTKLIFYTRKGMEEIIKLFPNISENMNLNYDIKLIADVFLYEKINAVVSTFPYANMSIDFYTTIHENNNSIKHYKCIHNNINLHFK